ncbi:MAG: hypothetical protein H8E44_11780 [Planctomycetes bacterium]|nr:hypothetical protein [Planctomycetota bacterium]
MPNREAYSGERNDGEPRGDLKADQPSDYTLTAGPLVITQQGLRSLEQFAFPRVSGIGH